MFLSLVFANIDVRWHLRKKHPCKKVVMKLASSVRINKYGRTGINMSTSNPALSKNLQSKPNTDLKFFCMAKLVHGAFSMFR